MTLSRGLLLLSLCLPLSISSQAAFALSKDEIRLRQNQRIEIPTSPVGRAVTDAFTLFESGNSLAAVDLLLATNPQTDYDKAFINKFIGNLYATVDGQEFKAHQYLEAAVEKEVLNYKEHGEVLQLLAQLTMMSKQYLQAIDWYNKWMRYTNQADAQAYVRIAAAYFELGRYGNVIYPAKKAIELGGKGLEGYRFIIYAYHSLGDYRHAAEYAQQLYQQDPSNEENTALLAYLYLNSFQSQKTIALFEPKLKDKTITPEMFYLYARANADQNNPKHCLELMTGYADEFKLTDNDDYWAALGYCQEKLGNHKLAAEHYQQAWANKEKSEYLINRGKNLLAAKQLSLAVEVLQQAIEVKRNNPHQAQLYLAQAYYHQNKLSEAKKYLELAAGDKRLSDEVKLWLEKVGSKI